MQSILVTGDFLVDHHIYEGNRHHFGDQRSRGVCVQEELGGAALIHRLLQEFQAAAGARWQSGLAIDEAAALESQRSCSSGGTGCVDRPFAAYAFWRPYPAADQGKGSRWRVAESMGFGGGTSGASVWPWKWCKDRPVAPDMVVISDGGIGFRGRTNFARWGIPVRDTRLLELMQKVSQSDDVTPSPLSDAEPQWILLKMSAPIGAGDLWRELSQFHAERLVVVVSASELRRAGVRISSGLSWEQTLEDVHQALRSHPALQSLGRARHLIISFDSEGALWLRRVDTTLKATFLFDQECVEGERRLGVDGQVYGLLSCLTATVAAEIAAKPGDPDFVSGMRKGIAAMRHLRAEGHGDAGMRGGGFPAKALADAAQCGSALQMRSFLCDASCPVRTGWSLLALHEAPSSSGPAVPLYGIARRVLIQGPRALRAPTLKIGDFFTADRGEIEALRSLRQLVRRYLDDRKADKPLSIGVFGPPGAGKSFAVRELAKHLLGDRLGWLEFNLSQFNGAADLIGALHQVRDKILEGKLPVAFFDEFDSQNLTWLKYLLAPMQDGRFQEGQLSHPVGQCLFVFAGGTSHTFEEFAAKGDATDQAALHFVQSKGPDFASRLDGRLNVVGPNPRPPMKVGDLDIFFPVRRALFLRTRLKCGGTERLRIEPGVATALLEVLKFKHGARSLTKLVEPWRVLRRTEPNQLLGASALLPRDQLELLVDLADFDGLIQRDEAMANRLGVDHLAAAVHDFYRALGKTQGFLKPHHDCDFVDLAPFDQESNRAAARRMPAILALAGLKLEPGHPTTEELTRAVERLAFHQDLLAEAEHDGWMDWHFDNGWSRADTRDDAQQQHHLLVSYDRLTDDERNEDRDAIRNYPEIAKLADLKIVPST